MRCRHHVITHEQGMPYQCNALGFKSARIPCKVVLESSGLPCLAYAPRRSRN